MLKKLKGVLLIFLVSLIGTVFGLSTIGTTFDKSIGLPWLFKVRGPIDPPTNVAVIGISGQTGERLGLSRAPRNWPRTIHAQLLDALVKRGASVVVFDIHFFEPKEKADDLFFAESIAKSNRAVLFEKLNGKRQPVTDQTGKNVGWIWVEETIPPMESLANAAKGLGPFPLPKLAAELQQFWAFKASAADAPTLPAVALQLYAMPSFSKWRSLLEKIDHKTFTDLPLSGEEIVGAGQLRRVMVKLRQKFEQNPKLGRSVASELQNQVSDGGTSRATISALAQLYAGGAHRFVNFYGPPGSIETIPYSSVIKGSDPNLSESDLDFAGKVVFVGYSDLLDPGQPDRFYTVFTRDDGVDLSGVEIMATAFANLLTDRSLQPTGFIESGLIMLAFGVVIGVIAYLLPAMTGIPLAILIAVLYAVLTHYLFGAYDVWLPASTPLLVQFPTAIFFGLVGQYVVERRRSKQISEAIGYYLPEDVARNLTSGTPDPGKINKVVYSTCLATDMAGFSTMAEKMGPGELANLLNDYFDSLSAPLKSNHVDITEFRADAIMCAWTAESPQVSVRRNALLASLQAADAFALFKQRNPIYEGGLRIGLEAGMVHVGHSGGGGSFVYSIVGDCANTASRVEGLNKHIGTQVLATEAVVEGFENLLLREVGKFQFVGKSECVGIVEVVSKFELASPAQITLCERFAEAMACYRKTDWRKAQRLFEDVLQSYVNDGPAQFYWHQCQKYLDGEPVLEEPGVIRMSKK